MIYNKPINTIFVILCSFFLLTGFYAQNKHGHDFDTTNAQYLEIGVTEEEEVRELFGKPTSKLLLQMAKRFGFTLIYLPQLLP